MRIIFDDTQLNKAYELFSSFMKGLDVKGLLQYEWGTERIQSSLFAKSFDNFLQQNNFERGATVTHAHGIGNNCQYPLYYKGNPTEIQQVGYVNINSGLYGELYVYLSDYNQELVGRSYELTKGGVK